jgi:hypothetical protein
VCAIELMQIRHIKTQSIVPVVLTALLIVSLAGISIAAEVIPPQGASIILMPLSDTYNLDKSLRGAVRFRALIRNESTETITIAHPSFCFPSDYKMGESKHFSENHGKSEILFKATKPDGTIVVLRDGFFHGFDPENTRFLTIPANETGTFDVGWFFQAAEGRWERNDEAARLFTQSGKYRIVLLFRNLFPKALLYDEKTREIEFVDVWTGEMESGQITVDIK